MTPIILGSQSRQVFHYQIQATELHTCWRRRGGHSGFMVDCCLLGNCGCLLTYYPSHLHNVINDETGVRGGVWRCLVLCMVLFAFPLLILTSLELIAGFYCNYTGLFPILWIVRKERLLQVKCQMVPKFVFT
jgi:hypothetical protein